MVHTVILLGCMAFACYIIVRQEKEDRNSEL